MITANAGEVTRLALHLVNEDGSAVTGALPGSFTSRVYARGAASAVVATASELGSGDYLITLTPDEPGDWVVITEHDSGRKFQQEIEVGAHAVAQVVLVDRGSTIAVRAWLERNGRQVTAVTSGTVTLYDEAGAVVGTVALAGPPDARGYLTGTFTATLSDGQAFGALAEVVDVAGTTRTLHGAITPSPSA